MPQDVRDALQIRTSSQQTARQGVPQRVGASTRLSWITAVPRTSDDLTNGRARQRLSKVWRPVAYEQVAIPRGGPAIPEVRDDRHPYVLRQWEGAVPTFLI